MGLDQYAYRAQKANQSREFYEAKYSDDESLKGTVKDPVELAYWRKHPGLQGYMHRVWITRPGIVPESDFNGDVLELTLEDLDDLEATVLQGQLPETTGFFFGTMCNEENKETDLLFIKNARQAIAEGDRVFYNSSW
jgi:hypothetical protein